jgi:hypothetical protein
MPEHLYRGVHAKHPERAAAAAGVVIPAKPDANVTPKQHNVGGFSAVSQYTSWTRNIEVAQRFATRQGSGGVLLRVAEGTPLDGEFWSWEYSEDGWGEDEVLLRGIRVGVEVLES